MPPKSEKVPNKGPAKQAQSSQAGKDQAAPKPQAPSGKKSTAKAGSAHAATANGDQPAGENSRVLHSQIPKKPVETSGRGPSAEDAATAASAAKARPPRWTEGNGFKWVEELGCGAQGEVWKIRLAVPNAPATASKVEFAVKRGLIPEDIASKAKIGRNDLAKYYKEIANQRKCALASPLVLPVIAWTAEPNGSSLWLLYAMPVCERTLKSAIKHGGILGEFRPYVKLFTLQLSEGVAVIHGLGVVHGDLHQEGNLFIVKGAEGYRLVVGDFGISVDFDDVDQVDEAIKDSERPTASDREPTAAQRKRMASERKRKLQVRDLYAIPGTYVKMAYGLRPNRKGIEEEEDTMMDRLTEFYNKKLKYKETQPEQVKTDKSNERRFVITMLALDDAKELRLQAKDVKDLPFFQAGAILAGAKIGVDVQTAFDNQNIKWTDINAEALQKKIRAAQSK